MKTRTFFVLTLLCAWSLSSCKKDKSLTLDGHWLFPIAKGSFSLNSLSMFRHVQYHMEISAGDIGQPTGTPVSSPGLSIAHLGPAQVPINPCIARIDVDTLSYSGIFTNQFPVAISAGTRLVIRSSADTSQQANILGFATVAQDIPPGGHFDFDVSIRDKELDEYVYLYLENFQTPAFQNVVFSATPSTLDIQLNILTAHYVEIFSNRQCVSDDTTELDMSRDDLSADQTQGSVSDTAMSGNINAFADNSLPAGASFQLYFLNQDKTQVLDSLFPDGPFQATPGTTDLTGAPTDTTHNKAAIPISKNKLQRMKQAAFVASHLQLSTMGMTGTTQKANKDAALVLQLTGDLRMKIRF